MNKTATPKPEQTGYSWLFQCPPGLANSLRRELMYVGALDRKQTIFNKKQRNHDLVFAQRLKNEDGVERLRIAEIILRCPVFGRFKISKTQLARMAEEMKALGPRRLVVTVAGRTFQRHDLSRFIIRELSARGYEFDQEVEEEVWMFCVDEAYYFGIPVKKARDVEGREDRTEERRGSLPPSVAAAFAFAGEAKDTDVVMDPCCGSGSLLSELRAYAPGAKMYGMDIDPAAIKIAKANLSGAENVQLSVGDSRKANPGEQISLVLANLPFGVQFGDRKENPKLYREMLEAMIRIRNPEKWRAILFTSDTESLEKAAREISDLRLEEMFKIKVRGELAALYKATMRK